MDKNTSDSSKNTRPEVSKYAQSFSATWNAYPLQVTILRIGPRESNEAIIRVSGIDHELDGMILKYQKDDTGTGFNYVRNEESFLALRKHSDSHEDYEIYIDNDTVKLNVDTKTSKEINTQHFLTEYQQQNK